MVGLVIVTKVAKFEPFGLALAVGGGRRSAFNCRIHFAKTVRQWLWLDRKSLVACSHGNCSLIYIDMVYTNSPKRSILRMPSRR